MIVTILRLLWIIITTLSAVKGTHSKGLLYTHVRRTHLVLIGTIIVVLGTIREVAGTEMTIIVSIFSLFHNSSFVFNVSTDLCTVKRGLHAVVFR